LKHLGNKDYKLRISGPILDFSYLHNGTARLGIEKTRAILSAHFQTDFCLLWHTVFLNLKHTKFKIRLYLDWNFRTSFAKSRLFNDSSAFEDFLCDK